MGNCLKKLTKLSDIKTDSDANCCDNILCKSNCCMKFIYTRKKSNEIEDIT